MFRKGRKASPTFKSFLVAAAVMFFPLVVLGVVFLLIAVRQVGRFRLRIWQIMLAGAVAVLVAGQIAPLDALKAINLDVMLFLFGMFVVGRALEESGYLEYLAHRFFRRAKSASALVLAVLFGCGFGAALLMNDTLAIVGTPVVLLLSQKHRISAKMLLLTLAFAVTIGTVLSPIGNPQNLLIAIHGNVPNPFWTFLKYLFIPTVINLVAAYVLLRVFYPQEFKNGDLNHENVEVKDEKLTFLCKISLALVLVLIMTKIVLILADPSLDFKLTYIALAGAAPILLFSPKRFPILKTIDWSTLVFFAAMFVLMEAVWESGAIQAMIGGLGASLATVPAILAVSVLASQLLSNVPLVALYLPILAKAGAGTLQMIALAAGSTTAGNLLILGAASNVIIIQNAENRGETLTFWEFARVGIPLTLINVAVLLLFL